MLGLLKFIDLIKLNSAIFMYKAYYKMLPFNLQILFANNAASSYNTRRKDNFQQNYVRTTKKQMCLSSSGVILWNSLDPNLKLSTNLGIFKRCIKADLLSEYLST
jgi:hypothetical protein